MSSGVYSNRGILVRASYLVLAVVWYVILCGGRWVSKRRIVLCYHGVMPQQRERFAQQVARIRDRAVHGNREDHARARSRWGPQVVITFDDAFENLLVNAVPVLEEYRVPASVFVVAGNLGDNPRWSISADHPDACQRVMTAEQLVALSRHALIQVGSHTQTHPDLTQQPPDRVRWELTESKGNLEKMLGRPIVDVAFPHGAFNDTVRQIARAAGYRRIYTLEARLSGAETDEDVIGRFSMSPDVWPIEFHLTCAGAYIWLEWWRRCLRVVRQWVRWNR